MQAEIERDEKSEPHTRAESLTASRIRALESQVAELRAELRSRDSMGSSARCVPSIV